MMKNHSKKIDYYLTRICLLLVVAVAASGCEALAKVPQAAATPLALTPAAQVTITAEPLVLQLNLPTELVDDVGEAPLLMTPAALQEATAASIAQTPTPAATPTPQAANCGRSDALTLMILGIDENAQADAIRLARIDFSKAEVNLIAIPRDFFVSIVGFENSGIKKGRINATFGYGEYFRGAGSGAQALAENLKHNFGVEVDRQFVLHFAEISEYVDAIGGVDLVLEKAASDPLNYFPAGVNHLTGERAVAFMRIREFDSDFRRVDRQTLVLKALLYKVRGGLSTATSFRLITTLLKDNSTQSTLSLQDLQSLYCLSKVIDKENIHISVIPAEMFHSYITPNGGWVLIPHEDVPEFIHDALFQ